jgi:hypothetical protein
MAYMIDGMIILEPGELCCIINDLLTDRSELTMPTIIRGSFDGYVDANGWPCGVFTAADGRYYHAVGEQTIEVA